MTLESLAGEKLTPAVIAGLGAAVMMNAQRVALPDDEDELYGGYGRERERLERWMGVAMVLLFLVLYRKREITPILP